MNLPSKYLDLLKYATPCPDQHQGIEGTSSYVNSGTCHYMACTGAMEMIINKQRGISGNRPGGAGTERTDLSERWMMNIPVPEDLKKIENFNWISDRILIYNYYGRTLLGKDYPFTKGNHEGIQFNVRYNWVNTDLPKDWEKKFETVQVPKIDRKVLFGTCKTQNTLDVGILNEEHINIIKEALVKYASPVLAIYNGEDPYYHSVLIVGYDDEVHVGECPQVKGILRERELNEEHTKKVQSQIEKQGFLKNGVFYVRESEYYPYTNGFYEKSEFQYDYGLKDEKHVWQPYVAPFCKRSYDWMKFLGNHAVVIYPVEDEEKKIMKTRE